ncbi:MAG TPA: protein-methionine-sulfoxide reductase heme-binding subunit MsrQ [Polyangiaceae bacterium]|nr:protein-methionine-sulfoxide reductase heme-binding subunit MsrQ [Polyangiaceae bacterium]
MAAPRYPFLVPGVVAGSLVPFVSLAVRASRHLLGANPVSELLNQLGLLALVFLCASLACTPLKLALGWTWPMRVRKTLGLFAFFTALAHFSVYFALDQSFRVGAVLTDIAKRPFILLGALALLLLVPLALTSTAAAVRRLGFKAWKRIHRLVYAAVVLALLHFYLRMKADHSLPIGYALLVGGMFAIRIYAALLKFRADARRAERTLQG